MLSTKPWSRIDSTYFGKEGLAIEAQLLAGPNDDLASQTASILSFGAYALTNQVEYQDEGIPFLRGTNIRGGFVSFGDCLHIDSAANQLLHKSKIDPETVLLSMSGTVGETAVALPEWNYPINSNQDIAKIRTKNVSPYYLAAFLGSRFGQVQSARLPVGSVQQHIFLSMIETLRIARLGAKLEGAVAAVTRRAYVARNDVSRIIARAEEDLLIALGLRDWSPPEPLTYSARVNAALAAVRLDARFFAPRIQALLDILSKDGRRVSDVARHRREKFRPEQHEVFDYIEISDIDGEGSAGSNRLLAVDAPSRATWHVRPDDIITSTVRPIRRLSAQIRPEQDGFVCSSGFVVVQPQDIAPEVLLTYLRLPVICELLDLYASASMYPAITDAHILDLPLPLLPEHLADQVITDVHGARMARQGALRLLGLARRAVEISIEDSEAAALAYLADAEEAN